MARHLDHYMRAAVAANSAVPEFQFGSPQHDEWLKIYDTTLDALNRRRRRCTDCGTNWADSPSRLCPACEAYQSHKA